MEKSSELDTKYKKLATEYSKVRSHATVLKKALLDEQAKNLDLREVIKKHEQQIRKHDQEMESLTFRNEQLTKRIAVLQQELQGGGNNKKNKGRMENPPSTDLSVLNEELQKKILENAQLVSSMVDKDFQVADLEEKIRWLEKKIDTLQHDLEHREKSYCDEIDKLKKQKQALESKIGALQTNGSIPRTEEPNQEQTKYWQDEAERWRTECELLRSRPVTNEELTKYYESQISEILETKQLALSETKSLWAENLALNSRLEQLIIEHAKLETQYEHSKEELNLTSQNYKTQLDVMTEHLAAQNDKITKQCDEIELLKHRLSLKK